MGGAYSEYSGEVITILPRLTNVKTEEDVLQIVYEELVHWFDEECAGLNEKHRQASKEIYEAWLGIGDEG